MHFFFNATWIAWKIGTTRAKYALTRPFRT